MAAGPEVQAGELKGLQAPLGARTLQHPQPRCALVLPLSLRGCPGVVGLVLPGERWQLCSQAPGVLSPSVLIPETWTPGTEAAGMCRACLKMLWCQSKLLY